MKQHSFHTISSIVTSPKIAISKLTKATPTKVIKDYEDLFLGKRSGHLTEYIYIADTGYYEKYLKEEGYYLPRLEAEILMKNSHEIADILGKNCNVIEIGSGPKYVMETKILPLLKSLYNIASYISVDIKEEYALKASQFIEEKLNIDCFAYSANCTVQLQRCCEGNACILFFGSTLSNFTDTEINKTFSNFASILKKNECVLFSVDCNVDLLSIKDAYVDTYYNKLFIMSIMHYFKRIFDIKNFDSTKFSCFHEWNNQTIYGNLVATDEQSFCFNNNQIVVSKGEEYHVVTSRKFKQEFIDNMLQRNHFKPLRKFTDDKSRMVIYLVQKY